MSEKTLKCDNITVNENEFYKYKQPIDIDLVNVDQIVVFDKFKDNDDGFKYLIGYKYIFLKLLCNILPQISRYIKYLKKVRKKHFLIIEGKAVFEKYK